jgi:hypothetical protein
MPIFIALIAAAIVAVICIPSKDGKDGSSESNGEKRPTDGAHRDGRGDDRVPSVSGGRIGDGENGQLNPPAPIIEKPQPIPAKELEGKSAVEKPPEIEAK